MVAALDDLALFEHEDRLRVAHGREPVRDDEHCAPRHERVHAVLDELFGAGIDGGRRLVENQHRRVGHGRPR